MRQKTMTDEIGTVVARTSRGEPISVEASAKPWCADTTTDADTTDTDDADDTVDRVLQKAEAAQRTRDAEQLEALREQLRTPITAGRFSEIASRGGRGPSSIIEKFFTPDEAE
jgi:hypothetical protein